MWDWDFPLQDLHSHLPRIKNANLLRDPTELGCTTHRAYRTLLSGLQGARSEGFYFFFRLRLRLRLRLMRLCPFFLERGRDATLIDSLTSGQRKRARPILETGSKDRQIDAILTKHAPSHSVPTSLFWYTLTSQWRIKIEREMRMKMRTRTKESEVLGVGMRIEIKMKATRTTKMWSALVVGFWLEIW